MEEILSFINFFAYIPGLEYVDDWKINSRTAFALFTTFFASIITTYSFVITFSGKGSMLMMGYFAFNGMVWGKLIVVISKHEKYVSVVQFIFKVFNANPTGPRERILMGLTELINYHMIVNLSGFALGYVIYSIFPLYDFFYLGKLTLVSPLLVPFLDPTTLRGYLITTAFNVFLVSFCVNICISTSGLFFTSVDSYDGLVSLVEHDFGEFDDMCKRKDPTKNRDAKMRNIIMELMDASRFANYLNDLYSTISTVQILMSAVVITYGLVSMKLWDNNINMIGALVAFYTEMIIYCYIGQLLDNTNMRAIAVISQAKWYTYELKHQKDIYIALYLCQNMPPILLAGMLPLNFETGLMITNKLYTGFMFMLEVIE